MKADCHLHVYRDGATVDEYRRVQARIGTTHAVIVQTAVEGVDNAVTLEAVAQLGIDRARGIAVLHPDASDALLRELHAGGVRGLRFSIHNPATAAVSVDMVAPLAARVAPLGWHVQLHFTAPQIVAQRAMIEALPCPMVFDHMARLPQPEGIRHPAFAIVAALLQQGRAWVKLSGPYLEGGDAAAVARAFVAAAPGRCVWGSDWPHPTERVKPDDLALREALDAWVPDPATRTGILCRNPCQLYGFR